MGVVVISDSRPREKELTGKTEKRVKHIPQRTCVGCRVVQSKRELIRVVRRPEGVLVDPTGKAAGRGAYLHNRRSCWERGLKGAVGHALKTNLTDEDRGRLQTFMETLPEDTADDRAEFSATEETVQ